MCPGGRFCYYEIDGRRRCGYAVPERLCNRYYSSCAAAYYKNSDTFSEILPYDTPCEGFANNRRVKVFWLSHIWCVKTFDIIPHLRISPPYGDNQPVEFGLVVHFYKSHGDTDAILTVTAEFGNLGLAYAKNHNESVSYGLTYAAEFEGPDVGRIVWNEKIGRFNPLVVNISYNQMVEKLTENQTAILSFRGYNRRTGSVKMLVYVHFLRKFTHSIADSIT